MELDATTFVLEVINFLVLLWLLYRFMFKPVQAALQARQTQDAARHQALADKEAALQADAQALAAQRASLVSQKSAAEASLASEMQALRQQSMKNLETELAAEREKAHARMAQEIARACDQSEKAQRQRATVFLNDYLMRLASPALEAGIVDVFLADLDSRAEQVSQVLRHGWDGRAGTQAAIDISTAYDTTAAQRDAVEARLHALLGQAAPIVWRQEKQLLAGISAHLPGYQLEASLRRGLDAFAVEGAPS